MLLVLVLAAAAVWWFGFRGSPSEPARQYVGKVCPAVTAWRQDIEFQADRMQTRLRDVHMPVDRIAAAKRYLFGDGIYPRLVLAAIRSAQRSFHDRGGQVQALDPNAGRFLGPALSTLTAAPDEPVNRVVAELTAETTPKVVRTEITTTSTCRRLLRSPSAGGRSAQASLLRTCEELLGVPLPRDARTATSMRTAFNLD